ncbi:hypothetical protein SUGI_0145810 [Cryptomeria japonica]|nr:hypothetical protein SUGI_0145810 [Cryptomeria japonica]
MEKPGISSRTCAIGCPEEWIISMLSPQNRCPKKVSCLLFDLNCREKWKFAVEPAADFFLRLSGLKIHSCSFRASRFVELRRLSSTVKAVL